MLTSAQIKNLNSFPKEDLLQIMHECAESLGCVSVSEYSEIMNMPKRTVYEYIKLGKIKTFKLSGHVFPLINV